MTAYSDTIYALSSGTLPAGVAVVRISGSQTFAIVDQLCGLPRQHRSAVLKTIRSRNDLVLDQALVLTFPGPHSFTGEDCAELHLHGSRAVVNAVLAELAGQRGTRLAEPGEFTQRAFDSGKIDLVKAEGLADLVHAETEMQRRLAVESGMGHLSRLYIEWKDKLSQARALIEAELDFADEDDVPGSVSDQVWDEMSALKVSIDNHLVSGKQAEIIRDGFNVVITGPPNAGKSSLPNVLADRDVAIVTDIAGTTRDVLTVDLDLEGYLVRFVDTAGIRESQDPIELEGIRRAKLAVKRADLVLRLEEIDSPPQQMDMQAPVPVWRVGTKLDRHHASLRYDLCLSSKTGEGVDLLRAKLLEKVRSVWTGGLTPLRVRHRDHLEHASNFIQNALDAGPLDLRAENLRLAGFALGRITGQVDAEQLLDLIFSQFCIGK